MKKEFSDFDLLSQTMKYSYKVYRSIEISKTPLNIPKLIMKPKKRKYYSKVAGSIRVSVLAPLWISASAISAVTVTPAALITAGIRKIKENSYRKKYKKLNKQKEKTEQLKNLISESSKTEDLNLKQVTSYGQQKVSTADRQL